MTAYARKRPDGSWEELSGTVTLSIDGDDFRFAAEGIGGLDPADLAANDVAAIAAAGPSPTDVKVLGQALADNAGVPTRVWTTVPFDLAELKPRLIRQVNDAAGAFRAQFITVVPGQAETYLAKEREARAWAEGDDPDSAPFLKAEAAVRGITVTALAQMIVALADDWTVLGAKIEARRQQALLAIEAAMTPAAALAAAEVDWAALLTA